MAFTDEGTGTTMLVQPSGFGGGHHGLEGGAGGGILKTGFRVISVFMHDREAFPLRKGANIHQLLLNGDIPLAGGGITRISDRRTGRAMKRF